MSTEDELRAALRRESERYVAPSGLWARIVEGMDQRSEGRGRRAAWIAIVVGALLITVAVIAVAAREDGDDAATATSGPPVAAAGGTTTPARGDELPGRIVAAQANGDVVVLDTVDEAPVLMLLDHNACAGCGPATSLSLAPGGATLFFQQEDGSNRIKRVAVAGGPVTTVADGCAPAPSPDGRRLAFVACGRGEEIVVRDLADGTDRRIPRGPGRAALTTQALAWSADGSSLYLSAGSTNGATQLWQLELATAKAQTDARLLGPPARLPEGTSWSHPRRHESKLAVLETCCGVGEDAFSAGASLVVLDLAGGREMKRIALDDDVHPVAVSFDDTGSHALIVTTDGDLYRRSDDAALQRVGGGYVDAVWS